MHKIKLMINRINVMIFTKVLFIMNPLYENICIIQVKKVFQTIVKISFFATIVDIGGVKHGCYSK